MWSWLAACTHGVPSPIEERLASTDLPLTVDLGEHPHRILVLLSGDTGWTREHRDLASALSARGIGVVGWSSLTYFWTARTPASLGTDLARVVAALPPELPVAVGGFSFGADTLPFAPMPERVDRVVLLSPARHAIWQVDLLGNLLGFDPTPWVVPEAIRGLGRRTLCVTPAEDEAGGCPIGGVESRTLDGGHWLGGRWGTRLAPMIERFLDDP
ncbi:MAG: hypothetical protein H6738_09230 [Alphaproteobacteria bacterium]|nr:hypothetical protein [Alphaproteobacteria bacterium]